jgi:hypothetical protein
MRGVIQVSNAAADLLGRSGVPYTMVAEVPVGSLVVVLSDWETAVMGEIEAEDHENPGFAAQGVKWIGQPRPEPGEAYQATPEFQDLLYKRVFERPPVGREPLAGDLAAVTWWFPNPDWYINVLEEAEGMENQPSLGFPTTPDMYGTLDMAQGWLVLSAGRKEWAPARKKPKLGSKAWAPGAPETRTIRLDDFLFTTTVLGPAREGALSLEAVIEDSRGNRAASIVPVHPHLAPAGDIHDDALQKLLADFYVGFEKDPDDFWYGKSVTEAGETREGALAFLADLERFDREALFRAISSLWEYTREQQEKAPEKPPEKERRERFQKFMREEIEKTFEERKRRGRGPGMGSKAWGPGAGEPRTVRHDGFSFSTTVLGPAPGGGLSVAAVIEDTEGRTATSIVGIDPQFGDIHDEALMMLEIDLVYVFEDPDAFWEHKGVLNSGETREGARAFVGDVERFDRDSLIRALNALSSSLSEERKQRPMKPRMKAFQKRLEEWAKRASRRWAEEGEGS